MRGDDDEARRWRVAGNLGMFSSSVVLPSSPSLSLVLLFFLFLIFYFIHFANHRWVSADGWDEGLGVNPGAGLSNSGTRV